DHARCVSVFCEPDDHTAPTEHDGCLPNGQLLHCHADATLDAVDCPSGTTCADGRCVAPGSVTPDAGAASGSAGELPDATRDGGMPTMHADGGGRPYTPPAGGCGCRVAEGGGTPIGAMVCVAL